MATKFSPCKGSYVLNQFPSNVMFGMNGFHVSASGAIQGHHGPLVYIVHSKNNLKTLVGKGKIARYKKFLLFPTRSFSLMENFLPISSTSELSSENAFSSSASEILASCKELTLYWSIMFQTAV